MEEKNLHEEPEVGVSPTLAERIAAMGANEETTRRLTELTEGLESEKATDDLLTTLARGITHDDDVQNADAAGAGGFKTFINATEIGVIIYFKKNGFFSGIE